MRLNILDEAQTKDENSACVWEYYSIWLSYSCQGATCCFLNLNPLGSNDLNFVFAKPTYGVILSSSSTVHHSTPTGTGY
jgi:hypothetical protein